MVSKLFGILLHSYFLKTKKQKILRSINVTYPGFQALPLTLTAINSKTLSKEDLENVRYVDIMVTLWYFAQYFKCENLELSSKFSACVTRLAGWFQKSDFEKWCDEISIDFRVNEPFQYIANNELIFAIIADADTLTAHSLLEKFQTAKAEIIAEFYEKLPVEVPVEKPMPVEKPTSKKEIKELRKKMLLRSIKLGSTKKGKLAWRGSSAPDVDQFLRSAVEVGNGICHPKLRQMADVKNGFLIWEIPVDGEYKLSCIGGSNLISPEESKSKSWPCTLAKGTQVTGTFTFSKGDKLEIILGQPGTNHQGGCGGTFVYHQTVGRKELLIAAGGAGGISDYSEHRADAPNGSIKHLGGHSDVSKNDSQIGQCGTNSDKGIGGAGVSQKSDSIESKSHGAKSYDDGFLGSYPISEKPISGGAMESVKLTERLHGGFGGGGGATVLNTGAGGGGGYSGGHAGILHGGGGGSFSRDPAGVITTDWENDLDLRVNPTGTCMIVAPEAILDEPIPEPVPKQPAKRPADSLVPNRTFNNGTLKSTEAKGEKPAPAKKRKKKQVDKKYNGNRGPMRGGYNGGGGYPPRSYQGRGPNQNYHSGAYGDPVLNNWLHGQSHGQYF